MSCESRQVRCCTSRWGTTCRHLRRTREYLSRGPGNRSPSSRASGRRSQWSESPAGDSGTITQMKMKPPSRPNPEQLWPLCPVQGFAEELALPRSCGARGRSGPVETTNCHILEWTVWHLLYENHKALLLVGEHPDGGLGHLLQAGVVHLQLLPAVCKLSWTILWEHV